VVFISVLFFFCFLVLSYSSFQFCSISPFSTFTFICQWGCRVVGGQRVATELALPEPEGVLGPVMLA